MASADDTIPSSDPTRRFSGRARDYERGRPGYPEAIADVLAAEAGLRRGSVVADVGSGTGISSELFLRRGCTVFGVEPNAAMREAAERRFRDVPAFVSVNGTAEATTLAAESVDLVSAAQAFHWFDGQAARRELARIMRADARAALFWNWRWQAGTPFLEAYEALLLRYGTDYREVRQRYPKRGSAALRDFFGGPYATHAFVHARALDLSEAKALLLSASYTPAAGHPHRAPLLRGLEHAFAAHARGGRVEIVYDSELHVGRLAGRDAPGDE